MPPSNNDLSGPLSPPRGPKKSKMAQKYMFFACFGHEMGLKSLENAVFGLAACQNIWIDILPASQLPKMAEHSKKSVVHFYLSLWSTFTQEIWLG